LSNIRITELDFDLIKNSLKDFLSNQTEFVDYDFEGSGWSVFLDILALNTHYNSYFANMLVNEKYLDSAIKRSSIVSIAKHLGYTPRSTVGANAELRLIVNNPLGNPTNITLESYTPFTTTIGENTYTFLNLEPITIEPVNGDYIFESVRVKEGSVSEFSHVVANPGTDEKYEIPTNNIDLSTLQVFVQTSITDISSIKYEHAKNLIDLTNESEIFYIEENPFGNYQIYFGDGVLGKKLERGNIIKMRYLISSGQEVNVSSVFDQNFHINAQIANSSDISVEVLSNSTGGADRESLQSIKFNAPKIYASKNRAVTESDYAALIKSDYIQVESVAVWGGEDNVPPIYGKVFISLKPFSGFVIDDITKSNIRNLILRERQMMTIIPEFVDPDILYLNLKVQSEYNSSATTISSTEIVGFIRDDIEDFFKEELSDFNKDFYYSKLIEKLNNSHSSILGTLLGVKIQKRINPVLNVQNSFLSANSLKYNNTIERGSVDSTIFLIVRNGVTVSVRIRDDSDGNLRLYNSSDNNAIELIGSVDYENGEIFIDGITPIGFPPNQFDIRIIVRPDLNDLNINTTRNQIILIDDSSSNVLSNRDSGVSINITAA